jgi:hypothetical protein
MNGQLLAALPVQESAPFRRISPELSSAFPTRPCRAPIKHALIARHQYLSDSILQWDVCRGAEDNLDWINDDATRTAPGTPVYWPGVTLRCPNLYLDRTGEYLSQHHVVRETGNGGIRRRANLCGI